ERASGVSRLGGADRAAVASEGAGADQPGPAATRRAGRRTGVADRPRSQPEHRVARHRPMPRRQQTDGPSASPAPTSRGRQPPGPRGLTESPGQDAGVKHQLELVNTCCRNPDDLPRPPNCRLTSGNSPDKTSRQRVLSKVVRTSFTYFKGAWSAPGQS